MLICVRCADNRSSNCFGNAVKLKLDSAGKSGMMVILEKSEFEKDSIFLRVKSWLAEGVYLSDNRAHLRKVG